MNFRDDVPGPFALLKTAIHLIPQLKYLLGIVAIAVTIAIVKRYVSVLEAVVGIITVPPLMTLFPVFVQYTYVLATPDKRQRYRQKRHFHLQVLVLSWFLLGIGMLTLFLLLTSFFGGWPRDFRLGFGKAANGGF